jgi:hypothetical protein
MSTQTQSCRIESADLGPEERTYVRSRFIDRCVKEAVALGGNAEAATRDAEQWFDKEHPEVQT